MTQKKLLMFGVIALSLAGVVLASVPFFSSLEPSARAWNDLPHIDVSGLKKGTFRYAGTGVKGSGIRWLIIRDHSNQLQAYIVPTLHGKVLMPDRRWFWGGGLCGDFRPELENSLIKPNGVIRCHDKNLDDWRSERKWSYDGKGLGESTPDMKRVRFKVEGRHLVVGKQ